MFYLWMHETEGPVAGFGCSIRLPPGMDEFPWNVGRRPAAALPEMIDYVTDSAAEPPDYPRTGGTETLVSRRVWEAVRPLVESGVDSYPSRIIGPGGREYPGFVSLDVRTFLDCVDYGRSALRSISLGKGVDISLFTRIAFDDGRIPSEVHLFRLKAHKRFLVADGEIRGGLEAVRPSGMRLVPLEEYSDFGNGPA